VGAEPGAAVRVADYMTPGPLTIGRDQSLQTARHLMRGGHVRHLPVLDAGELVGVLSDRELEAIATLPGSTHFTVEDAMVPDVFVTSEDAPLGEVAAEMARRRLGSAIVRRGENVVGVFTAVDALRALAAALDPPR
jgi:acetoin utilization protein AcuB